MQRSSVLVLVAIGLPAICPTEAAAQAATPTKPPLVFASADLSEQQKGELESASRMVARWAMVQRVVGAVVAQNGSAQSSERVAEIDRAWQAGESAGGVAEALMSNECAQALQAVLAANPGFAEAFVTDRQGALVCATHRTSDYFQGDEDLWRLAYAEGAGAIYVSAPARDPGSDVNVVHISVPVRSAGRTVGVLTVGKLADG